MLTLLKLFLVPRLRTLCIQVACVGGVGVISLMTGQMTLAILCGMMLAGVVYYNLLNVNLSENVEWLKNSMIKSKNLLMYYFFEQTVFIGLMMVMFVMLAGALSFSAPLLKEFQSSQDEIQQTLKGQAKLDEKMVMMKTFGATEMGLEFIFVILLLLEVAYGSELIKSYFLTLRFEKKFSKETIIFQGLLFVSFVFIALKDSYSQFWITHSKILFIPACIGLGLYTIILAANEAYKIFRKSWHSPLFIIPTSVSIGLVAVCLVFSKMNYRLANDLDKKIAEHRFQFIFASELPKKDLIKWYSSEISEANLAYLVNVHPLGKKDFKHFEQIIENKTSPEALVLITKMWPLKEMPSDVLLVYLDRMHGMIKDKDESVQRKYRTALKKNFDVLNSELAAHEMFQEATRLPASEK